jgi:PAS domain S-box-containing protein
MWFRSRKTRERDLHQQLKMQESQRLLIEAATATANAAQDVTTTLKSRLEDSIIQLESTARILNDSLFLCDLGGTIRTANPAAVRMFGRTDLFEASVTSLFDYGGQEIKDAQTVWDLIDHSSDWLPTSKTPLRGKRHDGVLFWIEPNITQLNWSNHTSSMLLMVRNIDPVVTLWGKAQAQRERYQSLFENTTHGILVEQNDTIVAANPLIGNLFGYDSDTLLGLRVAHLFSHEDKEKVEEDHMTCNLHVTGIHADGRLLNLQFIASQVAWNNQIARLVTLRPV